MFPVVFGSRVLFDLRKTLYYADLIDSNGF